jgi:hypothetical protein
VAPYRVEPYGSPLYASFLVALQEYLGAGALNFHLSLANSTTVQVIAGVNSAQVGLAIDGLWRFCSATVNTAVTGPAGVYDLYAVCGDNVFTPVVPGPPPEVDNTVYAFALQAIAHGESPSPTPTVTHWRKVGEVDWTGSAITCLRQFVGEFDNTQSLQPVADVPGLTPLIVQAAVGQTAPLQVWETAVKAALATLGADGSLALSGNLSALTAAIVGAVTAASVSAGNGAFGTLSVSGEADVGPLSTCPTVTPNTDRTTKMASTAFVHDVVDAYSLAKTTRDVHVLAFDDQTSPNPMADIIGSVPIALAAGQSATLIGVKHKCSSLGTSPYAVFRVLTDHAAHGTLVEVPGLTDISPSQGAFVSQYLGTPMPLFDGDEVAIAYDVEGSCLGVKLALVIETTF